MNTVYNSLFVQNVWLLFWKTILLFYVRNNASFGEEGCAVNSETTACVQTALKSLSPQFAKQFTFSYTLISRICKDLLSYV